MPTIKNIDLTWFKHDTFRLLADGKVIWTDPYQIKERKKADIILVSHAHHDHCDVDSLKKLCTDDTTLITTPLAKEKVDALPGKKKYLEPGKGITVDGVKVKAVHAYNVNKFRSPGTPFHPKGKNLGFIFEVHDTRVYFAGDTDPIKEMEDFGPIDVALIPISGTYVANVDEAVEIVKKIRPDVVVPMHVGRGIGSLDDRTEFKKKVGSLAKVKLLKST